MEPVRIFVLDPTKLKICWWYYFTPSEVWESGGTPRRLSSRAMPQCPEPEIEIVSSRVKNSFPKSHRCRILTRTEN